VPKNFSPVFQSPYFDFAAGLTRDFLCRLQPAGSPLLVDNASDWSIRHSADWFLVSADAPPPVASLEAVVLRIHGVTEPCAPEIFENDCITNELFLGYGAQ
jgi:hypothetical protein